MYKIFAFTMLLLVIDTVSPLVARSPIYSHLSTTIQGLPVIRSYSMQSVAMETFHAFQNQHSRAWYLYLVSSRWVYITTYLWEIFNKSLYFVDVFWDHLSNQVIFNLCLLNFILFRWFGMRIDLISNIFTAIVAFSSVLFRLTTGENIHYYKISNQ